MKPRSGKRQARGGAARQRPGSWGSQPPATVGCMNSLPLLTPLSPNLIGGASCGLQGKNPKEDTGQGAPCLPAHGARPHHSQLIKAEALGGKASTGGWGEPCWEGEPDSERTLDLSKRGGI